MKTITFDATNQIVGRLASKIAFELMDKNNPGFQFQTAEPKKIVVQHARLMRFTAKKMASKVYHHHSGYLGGLKTRKASDVFAANPAEVLEFAVSRMIPRNRLHKERMKMLDIRN